MSLLRIEELTVTYKRTPAVENLNLRVNEGELVGLIGPNGAGKTTVLKAVSGLVKPRAGTIRYDDRQLIGMVPERIVRMGLALVPEGRNIFQTLTVAENLALGKASGRRADSGLQEEVLDRFPILRRYYKEPAAGLSGGEQQQLAIARALLSNPRLLALDEPSLGLSPLMVDMVFRVLERLRAQGTTILLVEQNATRTIATADRTYLLSAGRLLAQGTSQELSAHPDIREAYLGRAAS